MRWNAEELEEDQEVVGVIRGVPVETEGYIEVDCPGRLAVVVFLTGWKAYSGDSDFDSKFGCYISNYTQRTSQINLFVCEEPQRRTFQLSIIVSCILLTER